jgi:hypothetical protein
MTTPKPEERASEETEEVECTLTPEGFEHRPDEVWKMLSQQYLRTAELDSGYRFVFDGTDDTLRAAATFISNELECCSFGEYTLTVAAPFEETTLEITGPEGTKELFKQLKQKLETDQTEFTFEDV